MNRNIQIVSAVQNGTTVTVNTLTPHGLAGGAVIYMENASPAWTGWQTVATVPGPNTFTFLTTTGSASATGGDAGVLIDDVSPHEFVGADQDSRSGNLSNGASRVFVVGQRTAAIALNGDRYSRALQAASRHHFTLTCGTQKIDQEFTTQTPALGDAHNDGLPVDRSNPGQYAYPTIQWNNQAQPLIDPFTGVRSFRATGPTGAPSTTQTFQTALDPNSAWQNPSGPLASGGSASYKGSCANSSGCPLFLRADNLSINGGATYTTGYGAGSSLDWVTVTVTKASAPGCTGTGCTVDACLTVNGVSCTSASRSVVMTPSPATYTFGTTSLMDLWQSSGAPPIARPDVSQATGTVNYNAASRQLTWTAGNVFSIKWTAGSRIKINGTEYPIAAVQNETLLTLASGPSGNLTGASYAADNFGVLIWKPAAGALNLGYTTFQYGSTGNPYWNSYSVQSCGPTVTVNGVAGNDCFVNQELYWISQNGSDLRDLGLVQLSYWPDGRWGSFACGQSSAPSQFDPANGDTWYCTTDLYFNASRLSIIKAQYMGAHTRNTPGQLLPDCGLDGGLQPCVQFTIMQPTPSEAFNISGPAFSPAFQASGYQAAFWLFGGVSNDGDLMLFTREVQGQDTPGWEFIFTLGDRTPAGTDANSIRPVAAASSYSHAPLSWCVLHATGVPLDGWTEFANNDFSYRGASYVYSTTLTSTALNTTPGAPGGLNACPSNPFGVTGQTCTTITVTGDPVQASTGSTLQPIAAGDLLHVDDEYMRVLVRNSATSLVVQRGYISTPQCHTATALPMACGAINSIGARVAYWNYRADPYGTNAGGNTIVADPTVDNAHGGSGPGVFINAPTGWWDVGQTLCPSAMLGSVPACYEIRHGDYAAMPTAPVMTVAGDAPFAGKIGIGYPNNVDSHPGPCVGSWCLDARPMDGGLATGTYTNVSGQLWQTSGATLNRKFLTTMAYVGRSSLVDVSGPHSVLTGTAADSYKYCVTLLAGECSAGSQPGQVFVNAPFVSVPSCYYPGIAIQGDDTNSICIGDIGAATGNLVQVGIAQEDLSAAGSRRLGPAYSRWNQQSVYWNAQASPTGAAAFSQVRWLDGVRHEDIISIVPPYPPTDGIARNTFQSVPVAATPPASLAVNNAIVEFGYAENGDPGSFFCTSRQEACVAVAGTVNTTTPFYYEQSETYSGMPCAFGCTVAVPAVSQHVVYYRIKFRNASGQVVYTGPEQAIVTQ
ncbi:MAG TPA: hypothetical protein VME43_27250 [Bryobacteraceae bacterium]|nr:hypothetical protein [Bryobacteraceae bacterium]